MKALLLAATSSLALTGFAMAQTAVETDTSGAAATPPAAGSTATDSSAAATTGTGGSGADATGGVAAGGADASGGTGTGTGDAASGTVSGGGMTPDPATGATTGTTTDATSGATTDAASGSTMGTGTDAASGTTGTAGMSPDAATGTTGTMDATGATDSTATTGTDAATTTTTTTVTATSGDASATMSADHPGMLGSWIMNRRIWTTNQPSSTEWANTTLTERPAEWSDIAKIDDIVIGADGSIMGYVADIGGFLGLGAKQVLLNEDALHFVQIGDDAFFATNFTREELEALPDFDTTTVLR